MGMSDMPTSAMSPVGVAIGSNHGTAMEDPTSMETVNHEEECILSTCRGTRFE